MENWRFKFRVWDSLDRKYLDAPAIWLSSDGYAHEEDCELSTIDYTVEQCTGLKDCKGNLIFEGDVIKVVDGCVHLGKKFEVVGCMIRWEMRDLSNDEYDTLMVGCCVEIIGNIHEMEQEQ